MALSDHHMSDLLIDGLFKAAISLAAYAAQNETKKLQRIIRVKI
jgi:hypothetical protein